jgi:hypothetical protein
MIIKSNEKKTLVRTDTVIIILSSLKLKKKFDLWSISAISKREKYMNLFN